MRVILGEYQPRLNDQYSLSIVPSKLGWIQLMKALKAFTNSMLDSAGNIQNKKDPLLTRA